ncbi:effector-associated constant component EACC1 [Ferrimonas marina]|uniref:Uncharacterized protein n=1 Tax=Ferrimonas marina TaxID=299255 RepID=A0A1M5X4L1_9GAMM|nr:hypothetical protein [Ferrimonas marina]SHH94800.1 hypothetical protein SAMN02745129_3225 [Ferrimonas marina]
MSLYIDVSADDPENALSLSRELVHSCRQEVGTDASLVEGPHQSGSKGAAELSTLLLEVLSAGAVPVLIEVLKSVLHRNPGVTIQIRNDQGEAVNLDADTIHQAATEQALRKAVD